LLIIVATSHSYTLPIINVDLQAQQLTTLLQI